MRFKCDYGPTHALKSPPNESGYKEAFTSQLKHSDAISLTICHVPCALISFTWDQSCNCDEKYPLILCTIFYGISIINLFIDMTNNLCCCERRSAHQNNEEKKVRRKNCSLVPH